MDLHRRRSVLVRMTETGEHLETTRIVNDRDLLAEVMSRAGESPEVVLEARGMVLATGPGTAAQRISARSFCVSVTSSERWVAGEGRYAVGLRPNLDPRAFGIRGVRRRRWPWAKHRAARLMQVDGPLTGLHAIRESVRHPVAAMANNGVAPAGLTAGTWTIDPAHSSISFSMRHLMVSKVRGTLGTFSGEITVASSGAPSVSAQIAVGSVTTGNDQRDAHLKSAEFFDVEQYPTATFTSTGVWTKGGGYVLERDFTLKGITKPISLGLECNGISPGMGGGAVAGFQASVVLNRKDFGIDFNIPLEAGGAALGNIAAAGLAKRTRLLPRDVCLADRQSANGASPVHTADTPPTNAFPTDRSSSWPPPSAPSRPAPSASVPRTAPPT
jgi:polyisoprenoid-binding protein YceI